MHEPAGRVRRSRHPAKYSALRPDFFTLSHRERCQNKITKEIRDRIQNHAMNDSSSVHYDRYDYNDE
ncbi:hypothetical protein GH771_08805 [Enterobacter cancerogenus]|nr:hypothetical protein GH771_08805 [Enterobacter cancerogenus]